MPMICSVCRHKSVGEINKSLIESRSLRYIADHWSVSKTALLRHRAHLPVALLKAKGAAEVASADVLLDQVKAAEARAERLYAAAEQILTRALEDSPRTALQAIKAAVDVMGEARQYLELRGKITGELNGGAGGGPGSDSRPIVNITFPVASPEQLAAVENAPVIDMPPQMRRLMQRRDGQAFGEPLIIGPYEPPNLTRKVV
jgi:hypothetical protein